MHSEFRGSRTIFYFRFSWGPPFGFFQWIINKFQLKIQRGDPMIIWNQKLFQIHETRCVSTNGQLDITHKFSSKSHNGFPIGAGIILHRVKLNASFQFHSRIFISTKICGSEGCRFSKHGQNPGLQTWRISCKFDETFLTPCLSSTYNETFRCRCPKDEQYSG